MKNVRIMRQAHLEELKSNIEKNIAAYKSKDSSLFPDPEAISFEIEVEADLDQLDKLRPSNSHEDEVANCLTVFCALKNLTPELARDERLWAFITHYHTLEYAVKRWPIVESDKGVSNFILSHYFAGTKRGAERDNAISRLWWMAYIANKAATGSLEDNLDALLQFFDVRAQIIERPTVSRSNRVLTAILEKLRDAHKVYKKNGTKGIFERKTFRELMKKVNAIGGYIVLDALAQHQVGKLINELLSKKSGTV